MNKFNGIRIFSSGLDKKFLDAGMAIIMNNFLVCHVSKVKEVPGRVISVCLLFKNKLLVTVLGLYAGAFSRTRFGQAVKINSFIVRALNSSIFVVLNGNFNENDSKKSASFRFCLDLGLANLFGAHQLVRAPTWSNLRCVEKTINYIFVSDSLSLTVAGQIVASVSDYFNTNHKAVVVLVGLGELLDMHKFKAVEVTAIRHTIDKKMENFCINKGCMIKSILDKSFYKVVFDYLVVDDELVLDPGEVKSKVNTREQSVFTPLSVSWSYQYAPLEYVDNNTFSGVMNVVKHLPDGKTAGLSEVVGSLKFVPKNEHSSSFVEKDIKNVNLQPTDIYNIQEKRPKTFSNTFGVLHRNNFSIFCGISTQSLIFAVGLVVKDALEKGKETSLWCIKMCNRFIKFFGGIYKNRLNHVMTNFGLLDDYQVLNSLDQGKVFSLFLWQIFYNPLLCEVKRQESICDYQIDIKFVAKLGRINNVGEITSFFTAGTFVNDTIWVESSQAVTQFILNVANKFFVINDILINNDKMVAISINQRVQNAVLRISKLPILIAKCDVSHRYLGIFLLTNDLFKPSLAKAQSNVKFFSNMVLCKAISDKQFIYLVSAVLQPIVSYHIQFSFVSSAVLYHLLLYGLKTFKQVQAERKFASVISFSNSSEVVGWLFKHHFLDLQILSWAPLNPLQYSVRLYVGLSNNFLAEIVCIFLVNNIFIVNNLPSAFLSPGKYFVSNVLRLFLYYDQISFLRKFGVAFCDRLLDKCNKEPVPFWFILILRFLHNKIFLSTLPNSNSLVNVNNVLLLDQFFVVKNGLLEIWSDSIFVFTDSSLKEFGFVDVIGSAAVFFSKIGLDIRVGVVGLLSSMMAELQAVVLMLECVPFSCLVEMCLDSQAALDVCVKRHSGVLNNVCVDVLACTFAYSSLLLPTNVHEHFMMANGMSISEIGPGSKILGGFSVCNIDWVRTMAVWHLNLGMLSGSISKNSAGLCSYFMKAVYDKLPVAVRKKLYDKNYPGVLCLHCEKVEFSDHVFTYSKKSVFHKKIFFEYVLVWRSLTSSRFPIPFVVSESLLSCVSNIGLYALLYKSFLTLCKMWVCIIILSCRSLLDDIVRLISIEDSFGVSFGFHKSCLFFSGSVNIISVYIDV
ncbi:hypothetical protein G9A89_016257 [Geosiphon pyriformis]|nr:hypothetical protein G9A89_016257 [Geosiphon pyriformis]